MATRGRKKSELSLLERLLEKIQINEVTDCWEFQGAKNNIGYGMIRDENKMRTTHRVSYEEHTNSMIPPGMCVCHTCDNPTCVNPAHLWLGTMQDNMDDMMNKGRGMRWGGNNTSNGIHPRLGMPNPKTQCPHCSRHISNTVYARHHGDNCKLKLIA